MSKIHFLSVRYGDSFVIECDKEGNHGVIVVDGGPNGGILLKEKLEEVGQPDLMVLTHYDEDHIYGLFQYMRMCQKGETLAAKEVWANCAGNVRKKDKKEMEAESERQDLPDHMEKSAKQGVKFSRILDELEQSGQVEWREDIIEGVVRELPFASIEVVSPTDEVRLYALEEQEAVAPDVPMSKAKAIDMKGVSKRLVDLKYTYEELARKTPGAPPADDKDALPNASSIAFILRCDDLSVLLLGDCYPHNVVAYLRSKGYSEENPLVVDYVKVAHHGSEHNTSNELLDLIKCNHYIISTNGEKFQHPHRHSIAHILCHPTRDWNETVHLYFNTDLKTLIENGSCFIKEGEQEAYNFVIHECTEEFPLEVLDVVPAQVPEIPGLVPVAQGSGQTMPGRSDERI